MLKDRLVAPGVRIFAGLVLAALLIVLFLTAQFTLPVTAQQDNVITPDIPVVPAGSAYRQTNFVSDLPGFAGIQDPLLVNPWGISATASSPFWIADNGTSSSTLYRGDVGGSPLVKNSSVGGGLAGITIPGSLPTGTVANTGGATDFVVTSGAASGKAAFLFASETGNILGWNPNVPAAGSTVAQIAKSMPGHVYKGLAIGSSAGAFRLYAADFANNKIDVFDSAFNLIGGPPTFVDPTVPADHHVFNIQNLGGSLYVTYAKFDPVTGDNLNGPGLGYVRRFNTDGVRDLTFVINNGPLDAPWGLVIAPSSFGIAGGALLVGNFSTETNSKINAFNPTTGAFLVGATLQNEAGVPISIQGLWALQFGNGGAGGDPNVLYFTAGIADEEHGLFGSLRPTTVSATSLVQFATDDFTIGEGSGHIDVTVIRAGDSSGTASVNVSTYDASQAGRASQKSDYEIALAKVTFNPGETSKTVRVLIVNDNFVEGDETINLALSNPTGAGVGLGSPNAATLKITDNDAVAPTTNPIDDATFFVRQQYLDFLNREPDAAGLAFWVNQITSCGADASCISLRRTNVSAAFFLSIEFQKTGMLSYLTNKAAFNAVPLYGVFEKDTQALQKDLTFGTPGFDAQLEANKVAYFNDFVARPDFIAQYPSSLTNAQYVDALLANAGISPGRFVVNLTNTQEVPPTVPTGRPGSYGVATFSLNAAQDAMTFTATVNNIDFTGAQSANTNDNLAAAHVHAGPTVAPGVNGPVVWGFFGAPFNDTTPNDVVNTPFAAGVGGTISGKWDAPEGNATTLAAQLSNILAGRAYINFHTTQFGGGEVRGNFPANTQAFRDSLVSGLTAATETRTTVLRKIAESQQFSDTEFNRAFVLMEYFGYLRRDSDQAGFAFWFDKLNTFQGNFLNADMVKAFITSSEYRQRFGP
ncbi:MAG TPA: TIGR03118 family protein [Pyrinomonadaceae bacterium]|nr:TIGR03118 family protein [Pyrinomonadaceae bacterium]